MKKKKTLPRTGSGSTSGNLGECVSIFENNTVILLKYILNVCFYEERKYKIFDEKIVSAEIPPRLC